MDLRNRVTAAALVTALALTVAGCTGQGTHPRPAEPPPALSATDIPTGMGKYTYPAAVLTVTLPTDSGRTTAAEITRIVDTLAGHPVTLTTRSDPDHHTVVEATWQAPASRNEVDAAAAKVRKADPAALASVRTRNVVGVRWTTTLAHRATASFPTTLRDSLVATLGGQYDVDVDGTSVTVTWSAPGLTAAGLDAITRTIAGQSDVHPDDVTVSPLT